MLHSGKPNFMGFCGFMCSIYGGTLIMITWDGIVYRYPPMAVAPQGFMAAAKFDGPMEYPVEGYVPVGQGHPGAQLAGFLVKLLGFPL